MKLLWLCNNQPGVIRSHIEGREAGAVNWMDHVLDDLRREGVTIRVLCPGDGQSGQLDDGCSYATFPAAKKPHECNPEQVPFFREQIRSFAPEVIHIWGVEYSHALAMANAAQELGMLSHTAASIQGLCGVCALHYFEGLPDRVVRRYTLRDFLRQDNIRQQQKKFALRGENERKAIGKLEHVIGRTLWDRACAENMNPQIQYHFCNETLREPFYEGQWCYDGCRKHQIFASSKLYSVKGFHYLLEALAQLKKTYPDARVCVTGDSYMTQGLNAAIRRDSYAKYLRELTRKHHLEDSIIFLGSLSARQMKEAFLEANVYVLPSTIENSPNSMGEAMLLGVPVVAASVGGVADLLRHGEEGLLYPPTSPYMLASLISRVFQMGEAAATYGQKAREHALQTHDPQTNLETLLAIYNSLI